MSRASQKMVFVLLLCIRAIKFFQRHTSRVLCRGLLPKPLTYAKLFIPSKHFDCVFASMFRASFGNNPIGRGHATRRLHSSLELTFIIQDKTTHSDLLNLALKEWKGKF